jgi:hypothetical protein
MRLGDAASWLLRMRLRDGAAPATFLQFDIQGFADPARLFRKESWFITLR